MRRIGDLADGRVKARICRTFGWRPGLPLDPCRAARRFRLETARAERLCREIGAGDISWSAAKRLS